MKRSASRIIADTLATLASMPRLELTATDLARKPPSGART